MSVWRASNGAANSSISSFDVKKFLCNIVLFATILGGLLGGAAFFLPDESAKKTMLGAQIEKQRRLEELTGGRVIIVGGSGCGQGFVTSNLCVALNRPVYNMGLHAGLGLIYQMKVVEPLVRRGDTVLVIPEYANFEESTCFGNTELLMMVCDIIPEQKKLLSFRQWLHLLPIIPKYGADKIRHVFMPTRVKDMSSDFDAFGDSIGSSATSRLAHVPFPLARHKGANSFNGTALGYISDFVAAVCAKGGEVYLFPPAFQASSFRRQERYVGNVYMQCDSAGLPFVALPSRYAMDDKYFYDSPYHLNRAGREIRSRLIIDDLKRLNECSEDAF